VDTALAECARRDPKGMYGEAARGGLLDFTGVSAPYERPEHPELRLRTEGHAPAACAQLVIEALVARGLV
jgi:bifunctional enzyme CysN/CysC